MSAGRYTVMDGDGNPVGTEEFRCAPGPMGWRYFSDIETAEPEPHHGVVDLVVDQTWRPVRTRVNTGVHEITLFAQEDLLAGFRDGEPVEVAWGPQMHLDYASPAYNAATANRLASTSEIEVVFLEAFTCAPAAERQRYELLGDAEIATPVGRFAARRWCYTALSTGWSRDLWVAGEVVVAYDGLYVLTWYEPGASGPRPLT